MKLVAWRYNDPEKSDWYEEWNIAVYQNGAKPQQYAVGISYA